MRFHRTVRVGQWHAAAPTILFTNETVAARESLHFFKCSWTTERF